jgi:8-oxo-dGTP diphosphatase
VAPPIIPSSRTNRLILWLWPRLPFGGGMKLFIAWLFHVRHAVGVAAVITDEAGDVLMLRHTYRGEGRQWGLPGGWVKGRESMEHAIAREIEEETGWCIDAPRLVAVHSGYPLTRMTIIFHARIRDGEFRPSDEVADYRFVPPDKLGPVLPAEAMAVRQALDLLQCRTAT